MASQDDSRSPPAPLTVASAAAETTVETAAAQTIPRIAPTTAPGVVSMSRADIDAWAARKAAGSQRRRQEELTTVSDDEGDDDAPAPSPPQPRSSTKKNAVRRKDNAELFRSKYAEYSPSARAAPTASTTPERHGAARRKTGAEHVRSQFDVDSSPESPAVTKRGAARRTGTGAELFRSKFDGEAASAATASAAAAATATATPPNPRFENDSTLEAVPERGTARRKRLGAELFRSKFDGAAAAVTPAEVTTTRRSEPSGDTPAQRILVSQPCNRRVKDNAGGMDSDARPGAYSVQSDGDAAGAAAAHGGGADPELADLTDEEREFLGLASADDEAHVDTAASSSEEEDEERGGGAMAVDAAERFNKTLDGSFVTDDDTPGAKLRHRRRTRTRIAVIVAALAVLGILLGVILGRGGTDDNDEATGGADTEAVTTTVPPTTAPSTSPTTNQPTIDLSRCFDAAMADPLQSERYQILLGQVGGDGDDFGPGTSRRKALCWLADLDTRIVNASNPTGGWQQRYILAVLYYSLYEANNDEVWVTPEQDECNWEHVECEGNVVTGLQLNMANLEGQIPDDIGSLTGLKSLDMSSNGLTGTFPPSVGNLVNLTSLALQINDIEGAIPPDIGNLTKLELLSLEKTDITSIPMELYRLSSLVSLDLSFTDLTGTTMPTEIGKLSSLEQLHLKSSGLGGHIPSSIGKLSNLWLLNLFGNNLVGGIPKELGNLVEAEALRLDQNSLTGSVPTTLGKLVNAEKMHFHYNQLNGTIPEEVCALRKDAGQAQLKLTDLRADCLEEVECNCCTECK